MGFNSAFKGLKVKLRKGEIMNETAKSTGILKTAVFAKGCCLYCKLLS
jgi:hypothetical protein